MCEVGDILILMNWNDLQLFNFLDKEKYFYLFEPTGRKVHILKNELIKFSFI